MGRGRLQSVEAFRFGYFTSDHLRVRIGFDMKTVEAIIEPNGNVRLIEPIAISSPCRALVTILEEVPIDHESALLTERVLAIDWNRDEEEAAWAHLQLDKSS